MYTIVDIAFAAMILAVGIILIAYLIIGGTTININIAKGIKNCIYAQIGNNIIPTLLEEKEYTQLEKIVQSCGASSIIIENSQGVPIYPNSKIVKEVLLKCSNILTIRLPLKNSIYILLICIR